MYWTQLLKEADHYAALLEELEVEESRSLSEYEYCERKEFFFTPEEEEWLERRRNDHRDHKKEKTDVKIKRCKKCGLSANDVLCPWNFSINKNGLCFQCWAEENQYIPDYRSPLQRHLDSFTHEEENGVKPNKKGGENDDTKNL